MDLSKIVGFQWDKGNIDKNYGKHGILPNECEEVFLDEDLKTFDDIKHSQKENRYIALGKTRSRQILYVVFTIRSSSIRVVSSRKANIKERKIYEKKY